MAKDKNEVRYDADGARRVMRGGDYMADFSGQLALGLMGNIVGQMTYFYTDKVGLAVGSVGIVMAIAKVIDAFTDVIFGNIIDHSVCRDSGGRGGVGALRYPCREREPVGKACVYHRKAV